MQWDMTVSTDEQCITHTQLLDQSFLILIDGDELAQIVGPVALQMHDHLIDAVVEDRFSMYEDVFPRKVLRLLRRDRTDIVILSGSSRVLCYSFRTHRRQYLRMRLIQNESRLYGLIQTQRPGKLVHDVIQRIDQCQRLLQQRLRTERDDILR